MNVIEGLGINSNYVHRWLGTQCYQEFWVAYSQMMITMLPSIQAAKSVTEYTEHRAGGCCYSQLTLCSEYSCDGNLRSWSLQQCQTALLINPPSLLEFKQDSVDSVKSLRDTEGLWGALVYFIPISKKQNSPQDKGET